MFDGLYKSFQGYPHLSSLNSSRTGDLAHYATATGGVGWMPPFPTRSLFNHDIYLSRHIIRHTMA